MTQSTSIQLKNWTSNEINANLVYLTDNMTNLHTILIHLIQEDIISNDERQLIESEKTDTRKIDLLLYIIQRKDWANRKPIFLKILNITGNRHCAEAIHQTPITLLTTNGSSILPSKWWPDKKTLPLAFQLRKSDDRLLTAQLKEMLSQKESNKTTAVTQKVTISGLGGIGKTITAIWFATQYENDYSYVIWIDCGEKSLLNSLRNLARDLDIKHFQDLEMKQLALRSFQVLKDSKCLFIFDNAECYAGTEGVKEVLPKFIKNFDVLITSRNKKWGDGTGDGEVPQFSMNLFDQQEGIEFMKNNIKGLSKNEESHIISLLGLLGNLPLALQIAVATVNKENIHLEEYIDRVRNTPEILLTNFDSYERTINKTLQISMDLLKAHTSDDKRRVGEVANKILSILGYVTPDDIPFEFFMRVGKSINMFDMQAAIKLLESYSLLSTKEKISSPPLTATRTPYSIFRSNHIQIKFIPPHITIATGRFSDNYHTLSIHRLLQKVIRHNTEQSQKSILKKILRCRGFLDYKLIPFSFANEKLQNKFPKLKEKLIDQLGIIELLKERRFAEAVELSRITSDTLKTPVSTFNFAVCLKQNSQLKESEVMLTSVIPMISNWSNPARHSTCLQLDLFKRLLNCHSNAVNKLTSKVENYYFTQWGTIDSSSILNKQVILGQLFSICLLKNDIQNARNMIFDSKQLILPTVPLNDIFTCLYSISLTTVFLKLHQDNNYITLKVTVGEGNDRKWELHSWVIDEHSLFPNELEHLKLINCEVSDKSKVFVDIGKIQTLTLENMKISTCTPLIIDQLTLKSVKVDEWCKAQWVLNKLFLHNLEFTQTNVLTITELDIKHSSVDINVLPKSLKKLKLNECFLVNSSLCVDRNPMPNLLQELSLINVYAEGKHGDQCTPFDVSHFVSPNLIKLKITDFGCKCSCLQLSMKVLTSVKFLHLEKCCVVLLPNIRLAPSELTLSIVRLVDSHNIAADTLINHFVDMSKLQVLHLTGMSIDFSVPVDILELTLINSNLVNWDTGYWTIRKLGIHPNPGYTQMKIRTWRNLPDAENVGKSSSIAIKKEKLLKFLKSISASKTLSGLFLWRNNNVFPEEIQRIAGMLPCVLTTWTPDCSAGVDEWQSFVEKAISNWNSHYLVHIRLFNRQHLNDILKDRKETSWIDLIEERGERNKLWKKFLDTLAPFFLQLQTAGVVPIVDLIPCINSKRYMWGGRGGLEGSLKLFQITKDYLTHHHGLTSLIWNWSLHVDGDVTRLQDYWPGKNYVDVATVDMQNIKELSSHEYQKLLDVVEDKAIAMEGMWSVPSTELLATQTRWAWFTVEDDKLEDYNMEQNTKLTFNSPSVINQATNQFFN